MKTENSWLNFADKVLPSLFVATAIGVGAASFGIWQSVAKLSFAVEQQEARLLKIESQLSNYVTRAELLEVLKRVEQQLEIALLKANIKPPIQIQ